MSKNSVFVRFLTIAYVSLQCNVCCAIVDHHTCTVIFGSVDLRGKDGDPGRVVLLHNS